MNGYLAAPGFAPLLAQELAHVQLTHGDLFLAEGPRQDPAWVRNVWYDVERLPIRSIGDAAQQLRQRQRNWCRYDPILHRRSALIQQKLPHVSHKAWRFGDPPPGAPLGSWTLQDETTLWAAANCRSPFANGVVRFVEDHCNPPSRAYLKLWEAFLVSGQQPQPGERCLELGASPGGWTWVLAELGAQVRAVDRSELAASLMVHPRVEFVSGNAFTQGPDEVGPVDWLFSDVICYPQRLLTFVHQWLDAGACQHAVCTLKFQGDEHYGVIADFRAIPGSRLWHLSANKHELTWVWHATS